MVDNAGNWVDIVVRDCGSSHCLHFFIQVGSKSHYLRLDRRSGQRFEEEKGENSCLHKTGEIKDKGTQYDYLTELRPICLSNYDLEMKLVSMVACFLYGYLAAHFQMWERWAVIFN